MKKEILLRPAKASPALFENLENKKLLKLMRPTKKTIGTRTKTGAVSKFYSSSERSGTHTLMSVGKRTESIKLSWHEDNEDFLLLNPLNLKFKKLYLIISFLKKTAFLKKAETGTLSEKDFAAVELKFDDPRLSFFTMLKNTVHCEITEKGSGQHPVFFVSEPASLKDNKIKMKNLDIRISTENK